MDGIPVFSYLQNTPLSSDPEGYSRFADSVDSRILGSFIEILARNNDAPSLLKPVLYKLGTRLAAMEAEKPGFVSEHISGLLKLLSGTEGIAPLLFILLGLLNKRKDGAARIALLEIISRTDFSIELILDLLTREGTSPTAIDVLSYCSDKIPCFIREIQRVEDPRILKNISQVLPSLPARYFLNYKSLEFLLESENYLLRNCFLEILELVVLLFKEEQNISAIGDILSIISEHICDVSYFVRGKALSIISNLFMKEALLKDSRNSIIAAISGRILDRTVAVRKKAVSLLTQLLINHPFRHRKDMSRGPSQEQENISSLKDRIEADFTEFAILMEHALAVLATLLEHTQKTDLHEILCFVKYAYLMKLNGSREALERALNMVFSKAKEQIVEMLREILAVDPGEIYSFANNRYFLSLLPSLGLDTRCFLDNFISGYLRFESINILLHCNYRPTDTEAVAVLTCTTELLFGSQDATELKEHTKIYSAALQVLQRVSSRLPHNHEIFKLISKSIVKMIFFEPVLIKNTVELFYSASQNPEKNCATLLHHICLGKDRLKIIESVGWIALHQFYLLERLERRFTAGSMKHEEIDSIRRSLDRASLPGLREKRMSVEDSKRTFNTVAGIRMSLRLDSLQESLKSKTEEEVADLFFYLKENELFQHPDALLSQFVPFVLSSLTRTDCSGHPDYLTQAVAFRALARMMITSSTFFHLHYETFIGALHHPSPEVRNDVLVALHDFAVFYNSTVDPALFFSLLDDPSLRKNALLCIFNLLYKNMIRIRGFAVHVTQLLFDPELGLISCELVRTFSSNNNIMSVLFYETFLSRLSSAHIEFLAGYVDCSIQESLFLKCLKAVSSEPDRGAEMAEKLGTVFKTFSLSDKFVQSQMFRPEMEMLTASVGK